ncbi:MAG: GNAT family protein [Candidatus ainarchaeum sp.]|nr:GNAT family protein [Candidatus ainarchaeum sp.]
MEKLRIEGERIFLRPITVSDVDGPYYGWMNDNEVTRFLEARFSKNDKASMKKFVQDALINKDVVFLAIVLKDGDRHIGNIKLGPINRQHGYGEVGILIGEKACWGKGYATEALKLLSDYAFGKLKLHKITAGCYAGNVGSAKAFLAAGFVQEGVRKSQYLCDGKYVDALIFGKVNPVSRDRG